MRRQYVHIGWSILLLVACLLDLQNKATAQFNLNVHNGLPSNHAYMVLRDTFGYLWVATDKGVARYNGYEVKLFNANDGLPSDDIWELDLDRKGRLWLSGYVSKPGYIYKNKYHSLSSFENEGRITEIRELTQTKSGVAFLAGSYKGRNDALVTEENGKIRIIQFREKHRGIFLTHHDEYLYLENIGPEARELSVIDLNSRTLIPKRICPCEGFFSQMAFYYPKSYVFNKYLIVHYRELGLLFAFNFVNCTVKRMLPEHNGDPNITLPITPGTQFIYINAKDTIYKVDSNLSCVYKLPVKTVLPPSAQTKNFNYFFEDDLWGNGVTTTSGVFFNRTGEYNFRPITEILADHSYLGQVGGSNYWWNEKELTLTATTKDGSRSFRQPGWRDVQRLFRFDSNRVIVFGSKIWLFNPTTGLSNFVPPVEYVNPAYPRPKYSGYPALFAKGVIIWNDSIYAATPRYFLRGYLRNDTMFYKTLSDRRYTEIVQDPFSGAIIAVSTSRLFFHMADGKDTSIALDHTGVGQLDKILISARTGDVLVKGYNTLHVFKRNNFHRRKLLANYNLSGAKLIQAGNLLIVAGRSGVIFLEMDNNYRTYAAYSNPNDKYYSTVIKVQIVNSSLMLTTDKGVLTVDLPKEKHAVNDLAGYYRLILTYGNDQYILKRTDSFHIDPENKKLNFDVIRPLGVGRLRMMYKIENVDTAWHETDGGAITLPKLSPGTYHTLSIKVSDDVWSSDTRLLHVFMRPYWWQTGSGRTLLFIAGILGFVGLVSVIVLVTRRSINRKNEKERRLLELELKSMYAQINPHFIFNSLNSALYLIKKEHTDKAYNHISKFSHLLRFYLKSSRNRYITLAEEITNLRNYIELQQTRFAHTFSYEITVDPSISAGTIKIPSLLLQPIVENAINHGLLPRESGRLSISIKEGTLVGSIQCIIEDNGIGRGQSKANRGEAEKESYGSDLIKELITTFNRYERTNITIEYIDKQLPETGTVVIVNINNPRQHG